MADSKPYLRDGEIIVDKDGIPHVTGAKPELMKEYRRRVIFAFNNLEASGDDETKEARSLKKKKARFGKRLMDNLHGEAWRVCQDLLLDSEKLRREDGYKEVLACLQKIEKVTVIKKTEAFDLFFDRCFRRRGQSIDQYLRQRSESWADLRDLAEGVNMSEDLLAYFLLKNVNLSRDEKRQVLLANQSDYSLAGIEKALRVSFFDVHEKEKGRDWTPGTARRPKGFGKRPNYAHAAAEENEDDGLDSYDEEDDYGDDQFAMAVEEEPYEPDEEDSPSDQGASGDEEVFQAHSTHKESRKKLKDLHKSRHFHRPKNAAMTAEERKAAVEREKSRTRCAACNRTGHWAGDAVCPKNGQSGLNNFKGGRGRSRSSSKGSGKPSGKGKAYLVSEEPLYFSLRDDDEDDGYCNLVHGKEEDSEGI